jgi:predicted PurR-regulated permease PerM
MPNSRRTDFADGGSELASLPDRARPVVVPVLSLGEFARRTAIAVLITLLILTLAYLSWQGSHVLLQAFAGVLLAVFLTTLSSRVSNRFGISYRWSLMMVIVGLLALTVGLAWLLANRLSIQIAELSRQLPQSVEEIRNYMVQYEWGRLLLNEAPQAAGSLAGQNVWSRVPGLIFGVTEFFVSVIVILFVGIFGAAEPDLYKQGLLHLVPPAYRQRARDILEAINYNLRGWLVGQIVLMLLLWVTTTLGLWLLGIRYALTLGLIAGLFELVPYVGPWISAAPALLVALLMGPFYVVITALLYLFLHLLEGYVLVPLIQRRAVELPPALTLVSQVLLGDLFGILGLFVAAPLTAVVFVILKMLYVEDTLGDQQVDVPGEPEHEPRPARTV